MIEGEMYEEKKPGLAALFLAVPVMIGILTGCGGQKDSGTQTAEDEKVNISMYMYDRSMFKEFTPWLEEKFPDIEFTFVQSYNSMDYYKDLLARGETAMIRATASMADSIREEYGINSVILPYYGEKCEDNWVLTYPMCQLAVSNTVEKDEAKKEAIMEVLLAIFSEEGQKHVAAGTSMLSYNKGSKDCFHGCPGVCTGLCGQKSSVYASGFHRGLCHLPGCGAQDDEGRI